MWIRRTILNVAVSLTALGIACRPAPIAGQADAAKLTVSDCESAWEGGVPDAEHVQQGEHSVKWAHGDSRSVTTGDIPHDWSGFNALSFWLYSEKATGSRFHVLLFSENAESDGIDYYSLALKVDFAGWRRLLIPFDEIGRVRSPLGWGNIERLTLHAAWDPRTVIDPDTVLYIDAVELTHSAAEGGPRMTDEELFEALDPDAAGMDRMRAALAKGDMAAAKHALAEHIRTRREPQWFTMRRERPAVPADRPDTTRADKIMAHELTIHGATKQFGPRIEWDANPLSEGEERTNEWNASLNRHYHMPPLVSAYLATGEDKYAAEVVAQITAWIEDCPVLVHSSGNSPYHYAWETLNVAVRIGRTWPDVFHQCLPSPAVTDEFIVQFLKSCCEHARHLMKWPSNGNWLTMESTGIFYTGVLYPMFREAADWRKTAIERLYMQLNEQVYPDGLEYELALGYNLFCLRNFTGVLDLAKLNARMDDIPEDYLATIENMYEYIMYATMPDSRAPGLNDSGDAAAAPLLRKGLEYFPDRRDFLYVATGGAEGEPPAETSHANPYSGHYIMRSGWGSGASYLLFDAGLFGAGHQHEDKLTFVLFANGRQQIIDAGNYYYNASRWRRYVLSTRGHNTIMVDGLDQHRRRNRETYILRPPFEPLDNEWVSDQSFEYVVGTYDDGYGPERKKIAAHTRGILFVKPDYWIVTDTLLPADNEQHTYESLFHLNADEATVDEHTKALTTATAERSRIAIVPLAAEGLEVNVVKGLEEEPVQGWANNPWRPVPTAIYRVRAKGPVDMLQVLYPVAAGKELPIAEVAAIPVEAEAPAVGAAIRFKDGAAHYFVQCREPGTDGRNVHFADFETDARIALVKVSAAGEIEQVLRVGGTFVRRGGG